MCVCGFGFRCVWRTAQLLSSILWDWLWCLMCVPLEMKIHCFNKSSTDRREKSVPLEKSVLGKADGEGLMVFNDGGRNLLQTSLCRRHPSNPLSLSRLCLVSFLNSVSCGRVAFCRLGECSNANFGPKDGCVYETGGRAQK